MRYMRELERNLRYARVYINICIPLGKTRSLGGVVIHLQKMVDTCGRRLFKWRYPLWDTCRDFHHNTFPKSYCLFGHANTVAI